MRDRILAFACLAAVSACGRGDAPVDSGGGSLLRYQAGPERPVTGLSDPDAKPPAAAPPSVQTPRPAESVPAKDDPDFPRKPPPRPGEWLYRFKERGQTVEQYKEECDNRRREGRETIVILPMGGILARNADTLESVREYCGIYYGCPAETAAAIPMPAETFVKDRKQYDADRILTELRNEVPAKALAYFGFCEEDLFSEGLNYVFGVASLRARVGVYSLARYGAKEAKEDGEPVFLKRTLKVASHELGHMYGLEHCVRYMCNLNGSNSVREMDQEPMNLCPECIEKVRWNTGLDAKARYEKLSAFYDKAGLKKDAAFARKQAERAARAAGAGPVNR